MKLLLAFGSGVAVALLGVSLFGSGPGVGVSFEEAGFDTAAVTRATVECSSANASTSVVGGSAGRSSFFAVNMGANLIYLCRGAGACSATSGVPLAVTSTNNGLVEGFEQRDGYTGLYTCRALTATTTLTVIYSQ